VVQELVGVSYPLHPGSMNCSLGYAAHWAGKSGNWLPIQVKRLCYGVGCQYVLSGSGYVRSSVVYVSACVSNGSNIDDGRGDFNLGHYNVAVCA
jgi:hypothetical protein